MTAPVAAADEGIWVERSDPTAHLAPIQSCSQGWRISRWERPMQPLTPFITARLPHAMGLPRLGLNVTHCPQRF